ncbi:hypothetical protein [Actinoplanes sp. GCM10030250]|uniref:hypothetical protein n=1 Tax=Actinoplanes sp. GCM10030250 TaxID=3273376 RepID=UPI003606DF52
MRRSPLIVMTAVLALTAVTGCSDDDDKKPAAAPEAASAPPSAEPTVSLDAPDGTAGTPKAEISDPSGFAPFSVQSIGVGAYEVGETQADLTEAGLLTNPVDAAGCTTATGTGMFSKPEVFLSGGKVVMVKATKDDPRIGKPLAELQAEFAEGKAVTGAAGATGWEVVEETNSLLFVATGGTVSAVAGGVTASVQKNFTSGSGC